MSKHSSSGRAWLAISKKVLKRDGYACQLQMTGCTGVATEVDHINPVSVDGVDEEWNLRASCKHCNGVKGAKVWTRTRYIDSDWLDFGTRSSA